MSKAWIVFGSLFFLVMEPIAAQDIPGILTSYFNEVRKGEFPPVNKYILLPEQAKKTIQGLEPFLADTAVAVRAKAYSILHLTGKNSRQPTTREMVVSKLAAASKDTDAGIVGQVLGYSKDFHRGDFNAMATNHWISHFRRKGYHLDEVIRLLGFLNAVEVADEVRSYTQPGNPQGIRWAALIALTRMNDVAAKEEVLRRVTKLGVNDDVVYRVFPDLVYTRQRDVFNYMINALNSSEKNCATADAERDTPIVCGYRIMEQFAPAIAGYPFKLDESGDLHTKDYVEALKIVRSWFEKNKQYNIILDTF